MSLGKSCEPHSIPITLCVECRGARKERERIIAIIREIETRHTNFYQLATSGEIIRAIEGFDV